MKNNAWVEIVALVKLAPKRFACVWILNIIQIIISGLMPLLIGQAIDGLLEKPIEWHWIMVLVILEIIYLLVGTLYRYLDTRVFIETSQNRKEKYYATYAVTATKNQLSVINSRLQLFDTTTEFIETEMMDILETVGSIVVALIYLTFASAYSSWYLIIVQIASISLSILVTKKWRNICLKNLYLDKDADEVEKDVVDSQSLSAFQKHLHRRRKYIIDDSDYDAKIFFLFRIIQISAFIVCIIITVTLSGVLSAGLLFTTISYTYQLNDEGISMNDHIVSIRNFTDSVARLKREICNDE